MQKYMQTIKNIIFLKNIKKRRNKENGAKKAKGGYVIVYYSKCFACPKWLTELIHIDVFILLNQRLF